MASRKNQDELVANPAKKFLKWANIQTVKVVDGEEFKKITGGEFRYSVKNEDTGEWSNISVEMPFEFAILNGDCFSWKGTDETKNNRFVWTNEVNGYTKSVTLKGKEKGENTSNLMSFNREDYSNKDKKEAIKEKLSGFAADYTQSVYISPKTKDGFTEIWNLQLQKAPLTGGNGKKRGNEIDPEDKYDGWFGFMKQCQLKSVNTLKNTIVVNSYKAKKNGDVKFMIPVYEVGNPIAEQEDAQLTVLFEELEAYHKVDAAKYNSKEEETLVAEGIDNNDSIE